MHRPRYITRIIGTGTLMSLLACSTPQSDLRTLCNAPKQVDFSSEHPGEQQMELAQYLESRLENEDVRKLYKALALMSHKKSAETLKSQAEKDGIKECPLIEHYEKLDQLQSTSNPSETPSDR